MEEKQIMPNPAVRCSYSAMVDPKTLHPHLANPNKHPPKQIELFISILNYQGWRRPITVSKLSNCVTKGHGALESALQAGFTEVPVDYQEYADSASELADIVADNQLQRMSEMDNGKLKEILINLDSGAFNMELTGFENIKLEKLFTAVGQPQTPPQFNGADGAPNSENFLPPQGSSELGAPSANASHVRMVQLFFNEVTQAEFMMIVEHFQKELGVDNATDTVLEVLRSAYRATQPESEPEPEYVSEPEGLPPGLAAPEGEVDGPAGSET